MRTSRLFGAALVFVTATLATTVVPSAQPATGTIAGVVRDPHGNPRAGLTISVTVSSVDGSPDGPGAVQTTDADGRYRISGIDPGRYHVSAGICSGPPQPSPACSHAVYHPGQEVRDAAIVVAVAAGAAVQGIDFVLDDPTVNAMQGAAARLASLRQGLWRLRRESTPLGISFPPVVGETWSSIEEMHAHVVAAFVATPGMGSGRMGPMSVQIDEWTRLLLIAEEGDVTPAAPWAVGTLDLIGMAMHDPPAVFSRVAHGTYARSGRALTAFEEQALSDLRAGRDIVTRPEPDGLHIVGAIRAATACLACHDASREGDVLGAFHYVLHDAAQPAPEEP